MMKSKFTLTPGCSVGVVVVGILIQAIAALLTLALPSSLRRLAATIVFFTPLPLGITGIIVGVKCFRDHNGRLLPLVGIILNALWLGFLAFICYMIFVVRITV